MLIIETIFYLIVIAISILLICLLKKRQLKAYKNTNTDSVNPRRFRGGTYLSSYEKNSEKEKPSYYNLKRVLAVILFVSVLLTLTYYIFNLWIYLQKNYYLNDPDSMYIGSEWGITFIAIMFILISVIGIIYDIVLIFLGGKHYRRELPRIYSIKAQVRSGLCIFLAVFSFAFPFIILNTDCYSRITKDTFCINDFFTLSEARYNIPEDIKYAETRAVSGSDYSFYYKVYFNDGRVFDLELTDHANDCPVIVKIDDILSENGVLIKRTSFFPDEMIAIEKQYFDPILSTVKHLYTVEDY